MPTTIATVPLGSAGSLVVSESAGVLTIVGTDAIPSAGITVGLNVGISAIGLVNAWAAGTTNAALKAGLTELALLLKALPV